MMKKSNNRHQAIAWLLRAGLQNSQSKAAGFEAEPQYYNLQPNLKAMVGRSQS